MITAPSTTFMRRTHNLLVTGQKYDGLPGDAAAQERIFAAVREVIAAFGKVSKTYTAPSEGEEKPLRILTGLTDETDEKVAEIAKTLNFPVHIIAPCPKGDADGAGTHATRLALIANQPNPRPSGEWIAATDDAKLLLADAMVVIWDGETPQGHAGGSVRLLIQALRRHIPIVWIDACPESAGKVRMLDAGSLDTSTLAMLGTSEEHVLKVRSLFSEAKSDLRSGLGRLVDPFWRPEHLGPLTEALQRDDIEPGETRRTWWGIVHSHFLSVFGHWKRKKPRPISAWRGSNEFVDATRLPRETWAWFDRLDRAATHAANKHRDHVVIIHLLSSLAVFGAVAGSIALWSLGGAFWGLFELGALAVIGVLVWHSQHRDITDHDAWLHFRQAAEALRMSAILHPLMASLPALHQGVWVRDKSLGTPALAKPYHWLVIQLLREAGAPSHGSMEARFDELSSGLQKLIADQIAYHNDAHHRYHKTHHWLHTITRWVFYLVVFFVIAHILALAVHALEHHGAHVAEHVSRMADFIHEQRWMLLVTAFFPALAAGLHGIASKMELPRLAKNSERMQERLEALRRAVEGLQPKDGPMALRALAIEAMVTMYSEHDAWAELMTDQGLDIPA